MTRESSQFYFPNEFPICSCLFLFENTENVMVTCIHQTPEKTESNLTCSLTLKRYLSQRLVQEKRENSQQSSAAYRIQFVLVHHPNLTSLQCGGQKHVKNNHFRRKHRRKQNYMRL